MRLSLVFELLLIFVLLAFAASRVIDGKGLRNTRRTPARIQGKISHKTRQNANRYCNCSTKLCNCCRQFSVPVLGIQGPGCATLQYLQGDRLAISMNFGQRVLTNTTISGRKPRPVCMPLPGGVSKFCGRVYNIGRQGEEFKACLGLELRALQDLEASVRVSCFRFGPKGLKVEPAQPLPVVQNVNSGGDDDDDDEYDEDDYGFDDDYGVDNDVDGVDYSAFSVFDDDDAYVGNFFGEESESDDVVFEQVPPSRPTRPSRPVKNRATTKPPRRRITRRPTRVPTSNVRKPAKKPSTSTVKAKPVTTTTARTVMIPVVTVTSDKKTEMPDLGLNSIPSQSDVSSESVPSSPHESIAAVTAMLQNLPEEVPQVAAVDAKPANLDSDSPPFDATPSSSITTSESITESHVKSATEQPASPTSLEISILGSTQSMTESTLHEKSVTTEELMSTTDEGEKMQNFILSKEVNGPNHDEDDDDDDDDDDEDDDDEDDEDDGNPFSAVASVIEDDDEDSSNSTKNQKEGSTKTESTDLMDDIVDGVVETITGEDADEKKTTEEKKADKEKDDEDDDKDDDDDDEDEARKIERKQNRRQSKDMWLDRLHW